MIAELLYKSQDKIGEAATWLEASQSFLWVDIDSCSLYEYNPATKQVVEHFLEDRVSTIIPTKNVGEVILAVKNKLVRYSLSTREQSVLVEIFPDAPMYRTNDGKASPEGRIWLGVMHMNDHKETGRLYCIDKDLTVRKVLEKQCIPNGIVWNKDGTKMYYADSGRACIEEYDYDTQTGDIRFSKVAVKVPAELGVPDGMTIDDQGRLWVAHWGGFGVYVWNPANGKLEDKIDLPVPNVASCTFGGKEMNQLFITTARAGLSDEELLSNPLSGSVFVTDISVTAGKNHYPFQKNNFCI